MNSRQYIVGVDLGGTKIHTGIVTRDFCILPGEVINPSESEGSRRHVCSNIIRSITQVLEKNTVLMEEVIGIGLGSPGPLDLKRGRILNAPNLHSLQSFNIKSFLTKKFKVPVFVNNDANCFVLGEAKFGAGKKASVVCGLTLGTGLGCGIVIDGKIYDGFTGTAAEIWCSPLGTSTVEETLSGKGFRKFYSGSRITVKEIADRAYYGEKKAVEAWKKYGVQMGITLAWIVNLLDPQIIILGGSIAAAFSLFQQSMMESLHCNINPLPRSKLKVCQSRLGNRANFLGAAALVSSG